MHGDFYDLFFILDNLNEIIKHHACHLVLCLLNIFVGDASGRMPVSSEMIHNGEVNAMDKQPCVYIITNKRNGTLYVGVTSNLPKRICEHKHKVVKGFT